MRVERTMMTADVTVGLTSHRGGGASAAPAPAPVPTGAGTTGPAPAGPVAPPQRVEAVQDDAEKGPVMPGLSASDRAAIASATGFYITASGKVTPEGMPPWGFISRYVEQRQAQRAESDPGVDAVEGSAPAADGDHVDVTV